MLGKVVGFLSRIRPTKFPPFPSPLEERLEPDSFSVSYYLDSIEKVGPRIWKWGREKKKNVDDSPRLSEEIVEIANAYFTERYQE